MTFNWNFHITESFYCHPLLLLCELNSFCNLCDQKMSLIWMTKWKLLAYLLPKSKYIWPSFYHSCWALKNSNDPGSAKYFYLWRKLHKIFLWSFSHTGITISLRFVILLGFGLDHLNNICSIKKALDTDSFLHFCQILWRKKNILRSTVFAIWCKYFCVNLSQSFALKARKKNILLFFLLV